MGVAHGTSHLHHHLRRGSRRQWRPGLPPGFRDEGAAADIAHRQVKLTLLLAKAVDGNNIWVHEAGGGRGFDAKALDQFRISGSDGGKDFQGDLPVEAHLPGAVDRPHAASGDQVRDDEVPQSPRAGGKWQVVVLRIFLQQESPGAGRA